MATASWQLCFALFYVPTSPQNGQGFGCRWQINCLPKWNCTKVKDAAGAPGSQVAVKPWDAGKKNER
jgi:hypothetical protein